MLDLCHIFFSEFLPKDLVKYIGTMHRIVFFIFNVKEEALCYLSGIARKYP